MLLLDEPSNDLDVETLRALEDALLEFPGSAMVISHDRWFLDRIATHILAFEGDSQGGSSSTATSTSTKPTRRSAWAKKAPAQNACVSSRSPDRSFIDRGPVPSGAGLLKRPRGLDFKRRRGRFSLGSIHFTNLYGMPTAN